MPSLRYSRPPGRGALITRWVAMSVFHGHPLTTTSRGTIWIPGNRRCISRNHSRTASWPRRSPPSACSPANMKRDCGRNCFTIGS